MMSPTVARNYHTAQIESFRAAGADMVTAITMTNTPEAIGITKAAQKAGMPSAISFTVETDGALPTRQKLSDAIAQVDTKTDIGPVYYMINCAHPNHFEDALAKGFARSGEMASTVGEHLANVEGIAGQLPSAAQRGPGESSRIEELQRVQAKTHTVRAVPPRRTRESLQPDSLQGLHRLRWLEVTADQEAGDEGTDRGPGDDRRLP